MQKAVAGERGRFQLLLRAAARKGGQIMGAGFDGRELPDGSWRLAVARDFGLLVQTGGSEGVRPGPVPAQHFLPREGA